MSQLSLLKDLTTISTISEKKKEATVSVKQTTDLEMKFEMKGKNDFLLLTYDYVISNWN